MIIFTRFGRVVAFLMVLGGIFLNSVSQFAVDAAG